MNSIAQLEATQTVTCRCCGEPMAASEQTFPRMVIHLVTCENEACKMRGYTRSVENYDNLDLSMYRTFDGECAK